MKIPLLMNAPSWPSIAFYKAIGAQVMDEWKLCRLSGAALAGFARAGAAS